VSLWLLAAAALLLCLLPCAVGVLRGTAADRLIALQAATVVCILALLALEQGLERQSFFDLSLAMAVLAIPSTLLFARFYRRWL
jgi:multisubunit Na+/H+ antiporter MnhF subunit